MLPRFIRFQIKYNVMFDNLCYSSCFATEIKNVENTVLEMVSLAQRESVFVGKYGVRS